MAMRFVGPVALAAALLAPGCSSSSNPATATDSGSGPIVDAARDGAPPDATPPLSNAEITGVLGAIYTGDMQEAQLAQMKSSSAIVLAYATKVVADDTKADQSLVAYEQQTSTSPAPSTPQQELEAYVAQVVMTLQIQNSVTFDLPFAQAQVLAQSQLATLVSDTLLPVATGDLVQLLDSTRDMVASHQTAAQTVVDQLSGGAPEAGTDAPPAP
jgi:predicted outer membrane protein